MYTISNKVIKFITEAMKNWKGELTAGINISRGENPERHLPGKLTFAAVIYNSNDAIQLRT